jgi:hypothetical protein
VRKFILNSFLLITSTICCLIILEFGIRFMMPHYDPSGHVNFIINKDGVPVSRKKGSFRQIKNTGDYNVLIKINSLGLREQKLLKSSTANDYFVVGDSFSFGWGVEEEERFSNILDGLLLDSKVFNISIPTDFNGYQKLISYAKKNGATINKLIVGVTMENDIQNYNVGLDKHFKRVFTPLDKLNLSWIKFFLQKNSASYFLLTSIIQQNSKLREFFQQLGFIADNLKVVKNLMYNKKRVKKSAKKLKSISSKVKTLALLIPSRGLWVGSKKNKKIADQLHKSFISEIKKLNIDYIDLRDIMESSHNPMTFHFKHDGHWTKDAHSIAANELAKKIRFGFKSYSQFN